MESKDTVTLPVLDVNDSDPETARSLFDAVSKHGFVYIKNNRGEIPPQDIDEMFGSSKEFFASPTESKAKFSVNSGSSGKNSGWFSMNSETLDPEKQKRGDFKEAFNMSEFKDGKAQQPLPPLLLQNEARLNTFFAQCHALCMRILELIAIGLEINTLAGGKDWFTAHHDRSRGSSGTVFRMLFYPTLPKSDAYDQETDIRAGAHSDYGTITLLFQKPGQPGLEILTSEKGEKEVWSAVPVNPTNEAKVPTLVNVGNLLSYWTKGLLKSAVHRVIFPKDGEGEDRYSMAYFLHPVDEARLEAVPSEKVRKQGKNESKVITAKQHLEERLSVTYAYKLQEKGEALSD
ncbi:Clavaminate synthase-like protein [Tothia fuscella]|uniref:Clavaminate synthase-like protein n=1 Tax=Tothia fuscella TaxID=1048955 RepID=A0A9P4NW05_9PEZI|nr:Clavaminate synthase-like protein [Tothia fuscella]